MSLAGISKYRKTLGKAAKVVAELDTAIDHMDNGRKINESAIDALTNRVANLQTDNDMLDSKTDVARSLRESINAAVVGAE